MLHLTTHIWKKQKQPSRGVPKKRFSENMQQIYRRTSMPKCDFNKAAKQKEKKRLLKKAFANKTFAKPYYESLIWRELLVFLA